MFAEGAVLSGAFAEGAVLSGALAEGAVLSGAFAEGAVLSGAFAEGAVLSGALAEGAVLAGIFALGCVLGTTPGEVARVPAAAFAVAPPADGLAVASPPAAAPPPPAAPAACAAIGAKVSVIPKKHSRARRTSRGEKRSRYVFMPDEVHRTCHGLFVVTPSQWSRVAPSRAQFAECLNAVPRKEPRLCET